MRISFHPDQVDLHDLCADLRLHGAVLWRGLYPSFHDVADVMKAQGVQVMLLCARVEDAFVNFTVRADLAGDIYAAEDRATVAIARWLDKGAPIPHLETLTFNGGFPRRKRLPWTSLHSPFWLEILPP